MGTVTIHVKGIGDLDFPDTMSDQEMEAAIKSHPDYTRASKPPGIASRLMSNQQAEINNEKLNQLPKVVKNESLDDLEQQHSGFMTSMVKGMPIVRHSIPTNKYQEQYEKENPKLSTTGNIAGAVTAMAPLSAAAGALSGPGLMMQLLGQGTLGAAASGGDLLAEKDGDVDAGEMLKALGKGGAWGMAGPLVSKGLSPTSLVPKKIPGPTKPDPSLTPYQQQVLKTRPNAAEVKPPPGPELDRLAQIQKNAGIKAQAAQDAKTPLKELPKWANYTIDHVKDSLIPAAAGHILGGAAGFPMAGLALGATLPHVKEVIKKAGPAWYNNSIMQGQPQSAILNALMMDVPIDYRGK